MKLIFLFFILISLPAFACWKVEANLQVDEDKIDINQKLEHDKTYSFFFGKYFAHIKILKNKKGELAPLNIWIQQKKNLEIMDVFHETLFIKDSYSEKRILKQQMSKQEINLKIMISEI
jgi:hypothetical protein